MGDLPVCTDDRLAQLTPDQGIAFLEHLAHNLTIMVRMAAGECAPHGTRTDDQVIHAMYWVNEALHNVVQLTRDLRVGREQWNSHQIAEWVQLWLSYKHAESLVKTALDLSFRDMSC